MNDHTTNNSTRAVTALPSLGHVSGETVFATLTWPCCGRDSLCYPYLAMFRARQSLLPLLGHVAGETVFATLTWPYFGRDSLCYPYLAMFRARQSLRQISPMPGKWLMRWYGFKSDIRSVDTKLSFQIRKLKSPTNTHTQSYIALTDVTSGSLNA